MDLTPKQETCLVWITVSFVIYSVSQVLYAAQAFVMNWFIMPGR